MSLINYKFSPTKDNGRFCKSKKCRFCKKQYINKLNFHNHEQNCDNYYKEDDFITDDIFYEKKTKSQKKSPKRSPRIICDDEDNEIIKDNQIIEDKIIKDNQIIEDKIIKDNQIIEEGEIIVFNNIEDKNVKNSENINKLQNNNKLILKRKRTTTIFINKHKHSNGLEVDPNFSKINGDKYFKYNDKNIISFDNKRIIIDTQNTDKLTVIF